MSKYDEMILVVDRDKLFGDDTFHGFRPFDTGSMLDTLGSEYSFTKRGPAEEDPSMQQVIPYLVLASGEPRQYLLYQRLSGGGEQRLHGKTSVGIGGHINPVDTGDAFEASFNFDFSPFEAQLGAIDAARAELIDILRNGIVRELDEELHVEGTLTARLLGFINDDETEVGRVHIGLVFLVETEQPSATSAEDHSIELIGWKTRQELAADADAMETWSQFVVRDALATGESKGS